VRPNLQVLLPSAGAWLIGDHLGSLPNLTMFSHLKKMVVLVQYWVFLLCLYLEIMYFSHFYHIPKSLILATPNETPYIYILVENGV